MRYNIVEGDFAREIVLLKGKDCSYGRCKFCNYTEDNDNNEDVIFAYNKPLLESITGFNQKLEIINSGNVFDLDNRTLESIQKIVKQKDIKILYFESYINHLHHFNEIRQMFPTCEVRFRLGLETFNDEYRTYLGKPFIYDNFQEKIEDNYYSVCLMFGTVGQTKEQILSDIEQGIKRFKQITVNLFIDNGTEIKADMELQKWFINEVVPTIKNHPQIELLIDNKDLGVFEQ